LSDLIEQAKAFATERHKNQPRKYEGTPYITHPIAVAARLEQFSHDPELIAAAYLHDTVEDTSTTLDEIGEKFGKRVQCLVHELTSDKPLAQKVGKAKYLIDKINHMSAQARLIKFIDREHNVSALDHGPKSFSERYSKETAEILSNLNFSPSFEEQEIITSIWEKIRPFLPKLN
jgi:(p)ppGpp synthase/HD superfamily hydrolase